ncbi:MAG: hypothetical protein OSB31_11355 [Paracoccaceae bacterium]|nr:hypothetical protein [Paracoccaceae bacterium]
MDRQRKRDSKSAVSPLGVLTFWMASWRLIVAALLRLTPSSIN